MIENNLMNTLEEVASSHEKSVEDIKQVWWKDLVLDLKETFKLLSELNCLDINELDETMVFLSDTWWIEIEPKEEEYDEWEGTQVTDAYFKYNYNHTSKFGEFQTITFKRPKLRKNKPVIPLSLTKTWKKNGAAGGEQIPYKDEWLLNKEREEEEFRTKEKLSAIKKQLQHMREFERTCIPITESLEPFDIFLYKNNYGSGNNGYVVIPDNLPVNVSYYTGSEFYKENIKPISVDNKQKIGGNWFDGKYIDYGGYIYQESGMAKPVIGLGGYHEDPDYMNQYYKGSVPEVMEAAIKAHEEILDSLSRMRKEKKLVRVVGFTAESDKGFGIPDDKSAKEGAEMLSEQLKMISSL